ncbi:MAG: HU family DNA-binding protein [Ignavibacteria bacterium]|jgi:DNA-binding protein HU-beta|nr:HU family DNA-binding protein [Ignavibacteria bacterium]
MNKAELISAIAEKTGSTKAAAEEALRATLDIFHESLVKGEDITLIGFGTFSVDLRAARKGRNPQTGEEIDIAEKKVAKFKAGKALTEAINVPVKPAKKGKAACGTKKKC